MPATATSAWLPLYMPPTAATTSHHPTPRNLGPYNFPTSTKLHGNAFSCRASTRRATSSITDFDLYDLLGIDSTSDPSRIKAAYRALQKQCHPDVAGPPGHDMAIILNEAYAVLSDPHSRSAYDQEQAKMAELRGYTGKPVYSVWLGPESEQRAVFVDEVKCVGCLKCALFAGKTFAIESVYGRARVVAQWADPESKVMEAIEACPVDCISMVERSDLAALEFLMSKQPRGNVRVGMGNAAGERVSNIFTDVKKFQNRFKETMENPSNQNFKGAGFQSEARLSAIQAIRSISNWLFWQTAHPTRPGSNSDQNLIRIAGNTSEISKLQAAASARKQARTSIKDRNGTASKHIYSNDYWIPTAPKLPPASTQTPNSTISEQKVEIEPTKELKELKDPAFEVADVQINPMRWGVPIWISTIATAVIQLREGGGSSGLKEHVAGSMALEVVNSSWMQVILTGITWYFIGMAMTGMVEIIARKVRS